MTGSNISLLTVMIEPFVCVLKGGYSSVSYFLSGLIINMNSVSLLVTPQDMCSLLKFRCYSKFCFGDTQRFRNTCGFSIV